MEGDIDFAANDLGCHIKREAFCDFTFQMIPDLHVHHGVEVLREEQGREFQGVAQGKCEKEEEERKKTFSTTSSIPEGFDVS